MVHRLDNQAVSKQEGRLDRGASMDWEGVKSLQECIKANDPDVWGELQAWTGKLEGGLEVRWHRGHPERWIGEDRGRWGEHDHWMYEVDRVADLGYGKEEVRREWWEFKHGPKYWVEWRGLKLRGRVREMMLKCTRKERMLQWAAGNVVNGVVRKEHERRKEASGADRTGHGKGRKRGRGVRKGLWGRGEKAEYRLQHLRNVQQEQQAWFHRTMLDGMLKKKWDTERMVLQIKVLAGFLGTRVAHFRGELERGEGGCRFCGHDTGRKEDNMHIMWECLGSTALVAARRQVVRKIREVWRETGVRVSDTALLGAVWELGRDGSLRAGKWEQLAGVLGEVHGEEEVLVGQLEDMLSKVMDGQGPKYARRGVLSGGGWVELLGMMGLEEAHAEEVVGKVEGVVMDGWVECWKVFNAEAKRGEMDGGLVLHDGKGEIRAAVEKVLDRLARVQGGLLSDGQSAVSRWTLDDRVSWLDSVDAERVKGKGWAESVEVAYRLGKQSRRRVNRGGLVSVREYLDRQRGGVQTDSETEAEGRSEDGGSGDDEGREGMGGLGPVGNAGGTEDMFSFMMYNSRREAAQSARVRRGSGRGSRSRAGGRSRARTGGTRRAVAGVSEGEEGDRDGGYREEESLCSEGGRSEEATEWQGTIGGDVEELSEVRCGGVTRGGSRCTRRKRGGGEGWRCAQHGDGVRVTEGAEHDTAILGEVRSLGRIGSAGANSGGRRKNIGKQIFLRCELYWEQGLFWEGESK